MSIYSTDNYILEAWKSARFQSVKLNVIIRVVHADISSDYNFYKILNY